MGVIVKLGKDEEIRKMMSLRPNMNDRRGLLITVSENSEMPEGELLGELRNTSKMYIDSMSSVLGAILGKPVSSENMTVEARGL